MNMFVIKLLFSIFKDQDKLLSILHRSTSQRNITDNVVPVAENVNVLPLHSKRKISCTIQRITPDPSTVISSLETSSCSKKKKCLTLKKDKVNP